MLAFKNKISQFVCAGLDDGTIMVLNIDNQVSIKTSWSAHTNKVISLALFNNGLLASGSDDFTIRFWNLTATTLFKKEFVLKRKTESKAEFINAKTSVNALVFLNNGLLASGTSDSNIYVWDYNLDSALFSLNTQSVVYSLCLLNNGFLASGLADGFIKIWDMDKRQLVKSLSGHTNSVKSLVVLKNGFLASGSEDKSVKIWDVDLGKEVKSFYGHQGGVNSLIVLSNGYLVSGSSDFSIKIWNVV